MQLLTKGPNFCEPRSLNFAKALNSIRCAITSCVDTLVANTTYKLKDFDDWKRNVVSKTEQRIEFLKNRLKPQSTKSVLKT